MCFSLTIIKISRAMETKEEEIFNCEIKLRENPERRKEKVYIGCGAGFAGDRPFAALKLLQRAPHLDYLVLECLAERTLADRYQVMVSGGDGYDPRISDWMGLLLPLAVERGTCIITNMGASKNVLSLSLHVVYFTLYTVSFVPGMFFGEEVDPLGAQEKIIDVATRLGLSITVAVAYEGVSTYMGAAPIVQCLEKYKPQVIITSRVADAALFLAPMVYELGWNWNDLNQLAQGSLAGHLLECGCQLTGGYFVHPGDKYRQMSFQHLVDLSLPFAEVGFNGDVCVAKAAGSGGIISFSTCAEQLLYEVGDPGSYITPDVVIDFGDVSFKSLSKDKVLCAGGKPSAGCVPDKLLQLVPKNCGWKGWGEISYGGTGSVKRAEAAEFLVRSWMEEVCPGVKNHLVAYIIGYDSLKATNLNEGTSLKRDAEDIRLRMDGLFELKEQAVHFVEEFTSLYTNGPAGGGGITTGYKKEIILEKYLVRRDCIFWKTGASQSKFVELGNQEKGSGKASVTFKLTQPIRYDSVQEEISTFPAPSGQKIALYDVVHSRAGDKSNDMNFSLIPHHLPDIERLKKIITVEWVQGVISSRLDVSSFPDTDAIEEKSRWVREHVKVEIYEAKGISSLNVVVRNILDGGVNCSRRIDKHGKTISDIILCQQVVLPP
ncbi:hypothetical protein GIB67_024501 [Kingdonia uniflora]|uniref:Uncharacterized protein n=1 Tax=Kingdonia uniflora TaxID=39325 RepID=A0A7J7LP49_9MAGN|nr:hypothetical protein GIB67_024501 [Kingdonia uniflora]